MCMPPNVIDMAEQASLLREMERVLESVAHCSDNVQQEVRRILNDASWDPHEMRLALSHACHSVGQEDGQPGGVLSFDIYGGNSAYPG